VEKIALGLKIGRRRLEWNAGKNMVTETYR
jgi:hypothetical protein